MRSKGFFISGLLLLAIAAWLNTSYIYLKAGLAQYLIADSWARSAAGVTIRPWSWADTWPIARIRFKSEDLYVLSGGHGSALAFGPGHLDGTAPPGTDGTSVVAGHRDTHFTQLRELSSGDLVEVQSLDKNWRRYTVSNTRVIDVRNEPGYIIRGTGSRLVLVTCYPFDAASPGGPLRYVVEADLAGERADRTSTLASANG